MKKLITIAALLSLCGCSTVSVTSLTADGNKSTAKALVPAWPWQDSNQVLSQLQAGSKTNSSTVSLKGVNQQQTTSTNATDLINSAIGTAVGAAVKAAIGK